MFSEQILLPLVANSVLVGAFWANIKGKIERNGDDVKTIKEALGLSNGHTIDKPAFVRRSEFEALHDKCPMCNSTKGDN